MKKLLILFLMLKAPGVFAQDITAVTIQWNCVSTTNTMNGQESGEETTLITAPGSIVWKGPHGEVRRSFTIEKVLASWRNISEAGMVQYYVHDQNDYGVLTVESKNGDRKATIVIGNDQPQSFELRISSHQQL